MIITRCFLSIRKKVLLKIKERGTYRKHVAKAIKTSDGTLKRWLEGNKEMPYSTLWRLFEHLEMDKEDLKRLW